MSLRSGIIPPTLNLETPDRESDGLVRPGPVDAGPGLALVNGFGFGGVNACMALRRWEG